MSLELSFVASNSVAFTAITSAAEPDLTETGITEWHAKLADDVGAEAIARALNAIIGQSHLFDEHLASCTGALVKFAKVPAIRDALRATGDLGLRASFAAMIRQENKGRTFEQKWFLSMQIWADLFECLL